MSRSRFYDEIKNALIERQVEDVYNKGIHFYFNNCEIEYPFACDGFVDTKTDAGKLLKLIIEYKFNETLSSKVARAKILVQVIYYMKRFEMNGFILPNVCMVGDKDECFVIHTNELLKYLDEDVDWSISPSSAADKNPEFVKHVSEDEKINPFIFIVDENFSFQDVANKIKDLAENVQRYVRVTEHNISKIYEYFCNRVMPKTKLSTKEQVALFISIITNHDEYYIHPTKKNSLVTPSGNVNIDGSAFESFFSYFQRQYTPQEKMKFTEIADRLIEDTDRRKSGDFFTPTRWVDKSQEMIGEVFGDDWRDKYAVWDCCCGTKNLTRDYRFGELYSSTLDSGELEIGKRYNHEGTAFQFDFLNDKIVGRDCLTGVYDDKLPKGLKDALLENKPIIFYINPPYATAGVYGSESKKDCAKTVINNEMLKDDFGACSQNLYAQFLYRIWKLKREFNLTNVHICVFCPTLFLSGSSFKKFRSTFLLDFAFEKAFQFKASEFADVAPTWGIGFTILKSMEQSTKSHFNQHEFEYGVAEYDGEDIAIKENKVVYNTDNETPGSEWIKSGLKTNIDLPHLSSGVTVKGDTGKGVNNMLGYVFSKCNNIDSNTQNVAIFSTLYSDGHGQCLVDSNFTRCTALFAARRLVQKNWINWADEYLAPNEEHEKYQEFVNDSIVYSLFESKSNQSSLRQVEYKGKLWDIKNEFFFIPKSTIQDLANEYGLDEIYNDARTSNDRYVYTKLQGLTLSNEAQAVLDKAIELTTKSFKYRQLWDDEHPEYQTTKCWDAGYYQLKGIWKEYLPKEFEEFKQLYKALSSKMLPMVYELGFLK